MPNKKLTNTSRRNEGMVNVCMRLFVKVNITHSNHHTEHERNKEYDEYRWNGEGNHK